jgi:hypothetical protein
MTCACRSVTQVSFRGVEYRVRHDQIQFSFLALRFGLSSVCTVEHFGRLDVAFSNAGVLERSLTTDITVESFR